MSPKLDVATGSLVAADSCTSRVGDGNKDVRMRDTAAGGRFRIGTEHGVEFFRALHLKNRKGAMKEVFRLAERMQSLFENVENIETVKQILLEMDLCFAVVMESHGKYHILIDDLKEREVSSKWMNDQDAHVFAVKQAANLWLSDIERKNVNPALRESENNFSGQNRSRHSDKFSQGILENTEDERGKHRLSDDMQKENQYIRTNDTCQQ